MSNSKAIIKQDTSAIVTAQRSSIGALTPWAAISDITNSITQCIDVWNREKNLTRRVKMECKAAIEIAFASVEKMEIQAKVLNRILDERIEERELLKDQLQRFWKEAESFDNLFKNLDLEQMKQFEESLMKYMDFKNAVLSKIERLFSQYYQYNGNLNLKLNEKN